MEKKFLGVGIGVTIVIIAAALATMMISPDSEPTIQQVGNNNENIGLVINSPNQSVSLEQLDEIFSDASSTGIGRSNVYLFWNAIEPERGEFDWRQSDLLMKLNEKNNLRTTLFFSVINGEQLGPFPYWIGNPSIQSIGEDRLANVLDEILTRYDIVDTVIIAGDTESQFRYKEQNIPVFQEFFTTVYDKVKEKHPDVKIGNSFGLHHVLNKDLQHIVSDLALGDFAAFSYTPTDVLNEINKTPADAKQDLEKIFEILPEHKIGLFEISWSTSDFVNGDTASQVEFMQNTFEFYTENEEQIEFLTWYRYYDRPEGTCVVEPAIIDEDGDSIELTGLGASSEHVVERLDYYICNAGLVDIEGNEKSGWNQFKNQIELIN